MSDVQDWTFLPDDLDSLLFEASRSYSVRQWHPDSGEPRDRDYENEVSADYYRFARQHFDYYLTWPASGERVWHAFNRRGEHAASIRIRQSGDFDKDEGMAARVFLLLRYLDEVRTGEAQPRKWLGFAGEFDCCKLIVPQPMA